MRITETPDIQGSNRGRASALVLAIVVAAAACKSDVQKVEETLRAQMPPGCQLVVGSALVSADCERAEDGARAREAITATCPQIRAAGIANIIARDMNPSVQRWRVTELATCTFTPQN